MIGGTEYRWADGGTFVVSSWVMHEHEAEGGEAVLFSCSERPIIDAFGLYREAALDTKWQG